MSALTRFLSKELKEAFGATDNPKFNPMFKETGGMLDDVSDPDTDTVAEFYSPMESAIENAPISKEGTRGRNIESFVRKRAPKVNKGELEYRGFGLEPERRYTKGSNSNVLDYADDYSIDKEAVDIGSLNIKALKKNPLYRNTQRQSNLTDPEVGYQELGIDVAGEDLGLMTHHGGSNLAHTRYSLRQNLLGSKAETEGLYNARTPDEGPDYILIEELQSDVIQNMSDNPSKVISQATEEYKEEFKSAMEDIAFKPEFDMPGTLFEDFEDFVFNNYLPITTNKKLSNQEASKAVRDVFEEAGFPTEGVNRSNAIETMFKQMMQEKLNVYDFSGMKNILGQVNAEIFDVIGTAKSITGKKETPIPKLTDSIRVLLQSVIADAKTKGIDEIVLPPIEKLAEKRFPAGSKEYKAAIAKGSGFHNTYVVAFEKALKQLKGELGSQVKIGKKDLRYRSGDNTLDNPILNRTMAERFPNGDIAKRVAKSDRDNSVTLKGTSINIKDLKLDPKKTKLRLNEGGLVQRPSA